MMIELVYLSYFSLSFGVCCQKEQIEGLTYFCHQGWLEIHVCNDLILLVTNFH